MLNKLIPKSTFGKNVLTLMTGSTLAQAIPILITPILTRMYSPEDFGVLALFVSITAIIGAIVNGRYELAIMLPEKDSDAINVAAVGLLIATVLSVFMIIPAFFLNGYFVKMLDNESIGFWFYFVPVVVWLIGLYNVLNYLNNRKGEYKDLAKAAVYKTVAQAAVQLGYGLIKATAGGLISGQIVLHLAGNTRLFLNAKSLYGFSALRWSEVGRMARRYIKFPVYSVMAILSNVLSNSLVSIFVSIFYSVTTLGFYSLTQRVLGVPSSLIGNAVGQVFFQEAAKERQKTGKAINVFKKTIIKLILFGAIVFLAIYVVAEDVIAFAFGEEWRVAGSYAKVLVPLFFIRFVVATVSTVETVMEKQGVYLVFNLFLLSSSLLVIYGFNSQPFETFLSWLVVLNSGVYLIYGWALYLMANNKI